MQPDPEQTKPDAPEGRPEQLHEHASQAEQHLEQLATGLARIDADPQAVEAITKMAGVVRTVASSLAKQGLEGQRAEGQPPEPQGQPTMDSATNDLQSDLKSRRP